MLKNYIFDWAKEVFNDKSELKKFRGTYLAPAKELSRSRFRQIVASHLARQDLLVGLAKEDFITGFENQDQFKTLKLETLQADIQKINAKCKHRIYILKQFQRETKDILERFEFDQVLLVNGSWQRSFHLRPEYYALAKKSAKFSLISPFSSEVEALDFASRHSFRTPKTELANETEILDLARQVARHSFDNSGQVGAVLAKKLKANSYQTLSLACNRVVPYPTYAWHKGLIRERHFSPPGDTAYYDTVHAEVGAILQALTQKSAIKDTTLFVTVMPCPHCARIIASLPIKEVVYEVDYPDKYAHELLVKSGKKIRRI
jgi:dCMP deaminase